MYHYIAEIASILVFFIGFYGVISSRSIIKSIVSIALMETSVVTFFLSFGFVDGVTPPIGTEMLNPADPLPQALMITAIVMGVAVTAINLTMMVSLTSKHESINWDDLKQ